MLIASDYVMPATFLLAGGLAVIVAGYVRASKHDIDATTEIAAIVVLGAGVLGGLGYVQVAAALTTLTVLLLAEKPRLHRLVSRLDESTMLAAARFAVMSAVILPLLPEGPFGPGPGVRPRELWILVLLFSGMSFVGYIAQRLSGANGYPLAGLLGGLVSSTSVTLTFARLSHAHKEQDGPLATGAVAASTVLFLRVAVAVAILNAALLPALVPYLVPPFLVALLVVALSWRSLRDLKSEEPVTRNPLQLRGAIEMALLFQVVLFVVFYARDWVGETGLLASGFVLGLTDVDALTLSMARSVSNGTTMDMAARAIAVGIIANSIMKALLAIIVGDRRFGVHAGLALAGMAAAGAVAMLL